MSKKTTVRTSNAPEQDRYTAALSYVWILCLYPLLFKRHSSFIQFHAKQGLALFILEVISFLFLVLAPLVIILCVILSIIGIRAAIAGKYWTLPFIGDWIKKTGI
jgi:uncharacterized membrane protein